MDPKLLLFCLFLFEAAALLAPAQAWGFDLPQTRASLRARRALTEFKAVEEPSSTTVVDAPCGRFPYVASVRQSDTRRHLCSGILVNSGWVLTASECLDFLEGNPVIHIGLCHVADQQESLAARTGVKTVTYPGSLLEGSKTVALIQLDSPVPASLPQLIPGSIKRNERLSLLGFGFEDIEIGDPVFGGLKIEQQVVVGQVPCGNGRETFCATTVKHKASCVGDAGAPFLSLDLSGGVQGGQPSKDLLVGMLLGGGSCPDDREPEVAVNLLAIRDWILETSGSV